jgi:hypothetical protein
VCAEVHIHIGMTYILLMLMTAQSLLVFVKEASEDRTVRSQNKVKRTNGLLVRSTTFFGSFDSLLFVPSYCSPKNRPVQHVPCNRPTFSRLKLPSANLLYS